MNSIKVIFPLAFFAFVLVTFVFAASPDVRGDVSMAMLKAEAIRDPVVKHALRIDTQ